MKDQDQETVEASKVKEESLEVAGANCSKKIWMRVFSVTGGNISVCINSVK